MEKELNLLFDNFSTSITSTKGVSWSQNNKAAVCFAETIVIYHITCAEYNGYAFKTILHKIFDILSLNKCCFPEGILHLKNSFSNLNETEKERFLTDATLCNAYIYPLEIWNTFKLAKFSPVDCDFMGPHCLLAVLTYSHQLIIFSEQTGEWKIFLECSLLIKVQASSNLKLPLTIGVDIDFDNYVDLIYNMSTVEIEWSSILKTHSESEPLILLLFTGSKNGRVSLWKVRNDMKCLDDNFIFLCSDYYKSTVTALKWQTLSPSEGILSIGYIDGSIRLLKVSTESDETCLVNIKEIFSDLHADNLAIDDLGWSKTNEGTNVLLACKQYFLFVYAVKDGLVNFVRHYHLESELQLSSISVFGRHGAVASLSGDIFNFKCTEEKGEITLDLTSVNLTCLQKDPKVQWLCKGLSKSEYSCLFLSANKLNGRSKYYEISKRVNSRHKVILFCPDKPSVELVHNTLTSTGSPQHLMVYLRVCIENSFNSCCNPTEFFDICHYLDKCDTIPSLQILRDITRCLKYWISLNVREHLLEELSPFSNVTEKLLLKYVGSVLQQDMTQLLDQDVQVLKAMLDWVNCKDSRLRVLGETVDIKTLNSVCQDAVLPGCMICPNDLHHLPEEALVAQCSKGHKIKLCCITFIPCMMSARKCEACGHNALDLQQLSGTKLLKQKHVCILCGGIVR
uniref:Uncharacterized protein n=1 Tax=Biomphalaria glabrata TaxID=6526 RepID=A0A2C9KE76_BIOGL